MDKQKIYEQEKSFLSPQRLQLEQYYLKQFESLKFQVEHWKQLANEKINQEKKLIQMAKDLMDLKQERIQSKSPNRNVEKKIIQGEVQDFKQELQDKLNKQQKKIISEQEQDSHISENQVSPMLQWQSDKQIDDLKKQVKKLNKKLKEQRESYLDLAELYNKVSNEHKELKLFKVVLNRMEDKDDDKKVLLSPLKRFQKAVRRIMMFRLFSSKKRETYIKSAFATESSVLVARKKSFQLNQEIQNQYQIQENQNQNSSNKMFLEIPSQQQLQFENVNKSQFIEKSRRDQGQEFRKQMQNQYLNVERIIQNQRDILLEKLQEYLEEIKINIKEKKFISKEMNEKGLSNDQILQFLEEQEKKESQVVELLQNLVQKIEKRNNLVNEQNLAIQNLKKMLQSDHFIENQRNLFKKQTDIQEKSLQLREQIFQVMQLNTENSRQIISIINQQKNLPQDIIQNIQMFNQNLQSSFELLQEESQNERFMLWQCLKGEQNLNQNLNQQISHLINQIISIEQAPLDDFLENKHFHKIKEFLQQEISSFQKQLDN